MARVFICYRREDTAEVIKPLYAALTAELPREAVFVDTESLLPGGDFRFAIYECLAEVDVVVALMGGGWEHTFHRITDVGAAENEDHVRVELETALRLRKTIIPALVGPAKRPAKDEVPRTVRDIVRLTSVGVRPDEPDGFAALVTAVKEALRLATQARIDTMASRTGLNPAGIAFVFRALRQAAIEADASGSPVSPQAICDAVRGLAENEFGERWRGCLARLDLTRSEDVGIIIYGLILAKVLEREPADHPSDFWGLGEF